MIGIESIVAHFDRGRDGANGGGPRGIRLAGARGAGIARSRGGGRSAARPAGARRRQGKRPAGTCRAGTRRRREGRGETRVVRRAGRFLLAAFLGTVHPAFAGDRGPVDPPLAPDRGLLMPGPDAGEGIVLAALDEDCGQAAVLFERSRQTAGAADADRLLSRAVQLCPRHAEALHDLGRVRERQGRLDEAEALYRRALEADPGNPAPHAGLGDLRFAREDYDGAASHYETFFAHLRSAQRLGGAGHLAGDEGRYREKLSLARRRAGSSGSSGPALTAAEITRGLTTVVVSSTGAREEAGGHYADHAHIDVPIYFDSGSTRISRRSRTQLGQIARALRSPALRSIRVRIDGHTDSRGSAGYNQTLSERRAESVKRALVEEHRISRERLKSAGFGESRPVEPNDTEAGRAANRRVTFVNLGSM